jgi:hypothetical protein
MGIIKNLSRLGALLAILGVIAAAFASTASASTGMIPVPGPPDTESGTAGVIVVRTVAGGMPGWQIAAIAIAAALVTAVAAVLVYRVLEARRRPLGMPA